MKKVIILSLFFLLSCSFNNNKDDIKEEIINDRDGYSIEQIFEGMELDERKINELEYKKEQLIENLDFHQEDINIIVYNEYLELENTDINDIDKDLLFNGLFNENGIKYMLYDFGFSKDINKFTKSLNIINEISKEENINQLDINCNSINFNNKMIDIFIDIKVESLILNENCGFKKESFDLTWYDKERLLSFFKKLKYIKELKIGYIDIDIFKKEEGKINFYFRYGDYFELDNENKSQEEIISEILK